MINSENQKMIENLYEEYVAKNTIQELIPILQEKLITDSNNSAFYYFKIGEIYFKDLKNFSQAEEYFKKSLSHDPSFLSPLEALCSLYLQQNQFDYYFKFAEEELLIVQNIQKKVELHLSIAEVYQQQNKLEEAANHWQSVLKLYPDHCDTMKNLASFYKIKEQWEEYAYIQEERVRFLSTPDETATLYIDLAIIYAEKLHNIENAFRSYRLAYQSQPNNAEILQAWYDLATKENNLSELITVVEYKTKLTPSFDLWMELGTLYKKSENWDNAILAYQRAWELEPTKWSAGDAIIEIYRQEKNYIALYPILAQKSLLNIPAKQKIDILTELADILVSHIKRYRDGLRYYGQILEIQPENKNAIEQSLAIYKNENNWQEQVLLYERLFANTSNAFSEEYLLSCKKLLENNDPKHNLLEKIEQRLWEETKDIKYLDELIAYYERTESFQTLAQTYETKLSLEQDTECKIDLLQKLASLYKDKIGDYEKLKDCYQTILSYTPDNVTLWNQLADLYLKQQNYKQALESWDHSLQLLPNGIEKSNILKSQGILYNEFLKDSKKAESCFLASFNMKPTLSVLSYLEPLYRSTNNMQAWIDLQQKKEQFFTINDVIQLKMMQAIVYHNDLQQTEKAKSILESLLQQYNYNSSIFHLLLSLYSESEIEKKRSLYEEYLTKVTNKEEKVNLLFSLGSLYSAPEQSVPIYLQILVLQPSHIPTLKVLQRIYEQTKQWTSLIEAYLAELAIYNTSNSRRIILHTRCANLYYTLGNKDNALEHYHKVLKYDNKNLEAIHGLQRIYREQDNKAELLNWLLQELIFIREESYIVSINEELSKLYEEENIEKAIKYYQIVYKYNSHDMRVIRHWTKLLQQNNQWEDYKNCLEEVLNWNDSSSIHNEIIQIAREKLDRLDIVQAHLEILLERKQLTPEQRIELASLYEKRNKKEDAKNLIQLYTWKLQDAKTDEELFSIQESIGILYCNMLNEVEEAIHCFRVVLEMNPLQQRSFQALSKIYTRLERWKDLAELYAHRAFALSGEEQENLLLKAGSIYSQKLNNTSKAFYYYQRTYLLHPKSYYAVRGMRRILESNKEWYRLVDILSIEVQLVSVEHKAGIYLKIANVWETQLFDCYRAAIYYVEMLHHRFQVDIAKKIIPWLQEARDYERLRTVLEQLLTYTELDKLERCQRQLELANLLLEHFSEQEKATQLYRSVLQVTPENTQAITALEKLYEQDELWEDLAILLEHKLDVIKKQGDLQDTHFQLAQLFHLRLCDDKKAMIHYECAWNLGDSAHTFVILNALKSFYPQWGEYKKYIEICTDEINLISTLSLKIELQKSIAEIYEVKLHAEDKAIEAWEKILEWDIHNETALNNLSRLYSRKYDINNVLRICELQLEDCTDVEKYTALGMSMAHRAWDNQGNYPKALQYLQKVLERSPYHAEALDFLEVLATQAKDTDTILYVLLKKTQQCNDIKNKISFYTRIADLCLEQSRWDEAIIHYKEALNLQPDHKQILNSLRDIYVKTENEQEFINCTLHLLSLYDTEEEKSQFYFEMASVFSFRDKNKSLEYLQKILAHNPHNLAALELISYITMQNKQWDLLVKYTTQWLESLKCPTFVPLYRQGWAYYNLKDKDAAIIAWEKAWHILPTHEDLTWQLIQIYYETRNWEKVRFYGQTLLNELLPAEIHYYRLGVATEYTGDMNTAILYYIKGLATFPNHTQMMLHYANIQFLSSQWESALFYYAQLSGKDTISLEQRQFIELRLSQIKDNMGMREGALEGYEQILKNDPKNEVALERVGYLYVQKHDIPEAIEKFMEYLPLCRDKDKKYSIYLQIAQLQENRGNVKDAITILQQALDEYELLPNSTNKIIPMLQSLLRLALLSNLWDDAYQYATQLSILPMDEIEQCNLQITLGNIQKDGYHNLPLALQHYINAYKTKPLYLAGIQAIVALYKTTNSWDNIITLYKEFLENTPKHSTQRIPILLDYAKILAETFGKQTETIPLYEEILQLAPDHQNSHIILANLYTKYPERRANAILEHRYLLEQNPFHLDSYHELYLLYLQENDYDKAYLCVNALDALGELLPEERKFLEQVTDRIPSGWLEENMLQSLLGAEENNILYEVMSLIDPNLDKIYPQYTEIRHSLKIKDKILLDSDEPMARLFHKIMTLLRIPDLNICIVEGNFLGIDNAQPPIVYIGKNYTQSLNMKQLTFLITQTLYYISCHHIMAQIMDYEDYHEYVQLLVENFAETGNQYSEEQDAMIRKFRALLPRKVRKQLEDRMDILTDLYNSDTEHFQNILHCASLHCALLITDSLKECIQLYMQMHNLTREKMMQDSICQDMFHFYFSQLHCDIRKELGLSIPFALGF